MKCVKTPTDIVFYRSPIVSCPFLANYAYQLLSKRRHFSPRIETPWLLYRHCRFFLILVLRIKCWHAWYALSGTNALLLFCLYATKLTCSCQYKCDIEIAVSHSDVFSFSHLAVLRAMPALWPPASSTCWLLSSRLISQSMGIFRGAPPTFATCPPPPPSPCGRFFAPTQPSIQPSKHKMTLELTEWSSIWIFTACNRQ